MIVDSLKNISLYSKISKDIYSGLTFIEKVNSTIELGTYVLNKRVKAIVESYKTVQDKKLEFESHKHVIDIQYPVTGRERIYWSPITSDMKVLKPYDKLNDRTIFTLPNSKSNYIDIGNKIFAIMFQNDGHSPKHPVNLPELIKKITIKVSLD